MRILFACEFFHPSVGGVQEVIRQIGERLAASGHDVTIATTFLPERTKCNVFGMQIVQFKAGGNAVRGLEGECDRYVGFVLQQDFDVLVVKAAQQWTFDALIPVLDKIVKPKVFIPCGFSCLYVPSYSEYFRQMRKWLSAFDRLVFYASDYRDIDMARSCGLTNIDVIPNGADEREFCIARDKSFRKRLGIEEDAFLVLTVGALNGSKGHLEVAKAFAKADFGGRRANLLLNGNTPHTPLEGKRHGLWTRAIDIYKERGLGDVLKRAVAKAIRCSSRDQQPTLKKILDGINTMPARSATVCDLARPELVQAYLNSDLFAFASRVEYSPLVLYEAAAAGLPFLAGPAGNTVEIAEWTGGGVICRATQDAMGYTHVDIDAMASQISMLAKDREKLRELGTAGRRSWEQRFTWDRIARLYESMLSDCVRSYGSKAVRRAFFA